MQGKLEGHSTWRRRAFAGAAFILAVVLLALCSTPASAQVDQGTINGTVTDPTGAVVPNAKVTLTDIHTGLVLNTTSNRSGQYVFSPIKIGDYTVSASVRGFSTGSLSGLVLNVNQVLLANLRLQPGNVSQTVTVKAGVEQLLQTQQSSSGQTFGTKVINDTPLSTRNYVFIAQLSAGVAQSNGSRGEKSGDFSANGLRAEQNDFILDGVDNNSNEVDFLNGASYVIEPPPDALAEFKVQTGNYSAEFGHSAGAVINASIKSGTNHLHGDVWEYWRNDALDARDYFARTTPVPEFRYNQFGGTIGGPFIKDHLFFFGDVQATRVVQGSTGTYTVPTPRMRNGDFSELLNNNLTGSSQQTILYQPGSNGTVPLACNNQPNVFCPGQVDTVAQGILNLYPLPNANGGKTFNNYIFNRHIVDNTVDWDARLDWNASASDRAFFRYSYYNERGNYAAPFGPILDGGGYGSDGPVVNMGENGDFSETHVFTPSLINAFRFGYNWAHPQYLQQSANTDIAPTVGLGGIPFGPNNGGLPSTSISGISSFGSPGFYPAIEYQNVFQVLDNVTKIAGNHTLKFGVSFQNLRFSTTAPIQPHGGYTFNGFYTSNPGVSFTGYGVADFLSNQMRSANLSNYFTIHNLQKYISGYANDDWKVNSRLTLNLGVRYDHYQAPQEHSDHQALWDPTAINGPGANVGNAANYILPASQTDTPLAPLFTSLIAANNIKLVYSGNRSLVDSQYYNISPRIGFAYQASDRAVIRAGFGIFYGGLESIGGAPNLAYNYPFAYTVNFTAPACTATNCPTDGLTLQNGFSNAIATGLQNNLSTPGLVGGQLQVHTPYTEQYNLTTQYALTNTMSWTLAYVGNVSRHLQAFPDQNAVFGLVGPGDNSQNDRPFPGFGGSQYDAYEGKASYNSFQTTLEKHASKGLYFLAAYTWGHAMDDTATPLDGGSNIYRSPLLLPVTSEYTNSDWDVRNRFTLTGDYSLPFGRGRRFLNRGGVVNELAGGWSADLTFFALTGNPFTVTPNNSGANGANTRRAFLTRDPFVAGGPTDPTNGGTTCPTSVRNVTNWFNPCAFANPLPGSDIANTQTTANPAGTPVTSDIVRFVGPARNQIYGPGYQRINMSFFKNFDTFRGQYFQFRADAFNVFNTPAFGQPNGGINSNGGVISSTRSLGNLTPNARFFQLAAKYYF